MANNFDQNHQNNCKIVIVYYIHYANAQALFHAFLVTPIKTTILQQIVTFKGGV